MESDDGWPHHRLHVVNTLQRLEKSLESIDNKVDEMKIQSANDLAELKIDVGALKIRASFWGAASGAVAAVGAAFSTKYFGH